MSTRTERAAELQQIIEAILVSTHADGEKITVTTDPRDVDKRGAGQHGMVLVAPSPRFEFPARGITRLVWTVFAITKPADTLTAFAVVDPILDALIASDLNLDSAEPGEYETADDLSPAFPGYVVTIQDDFHN